MPVDRWEPEKVIANGKRVLARRMRSAVLLVQGDVQRRISVGQPVVRTKAGNLRGLDPSRPGEPPKVVSSRLRTSITSRVETPGAEVIGRVGSNVPYARRLELGFFGTDARGRNVNQAARPYLRPALKEKLRRVMAILAGGA